MLLNIQIQHFLDWFCFFMEQTVHLFLTHQTKRDCMELLRFRLFSHGWDQTMNQTSGSKWNTYHPKDQKKLYFGLGFSS